MAIKNGKRATFSGGREASAIYRRRDKQIFKIKQQRRFFFNGDGFRPIGVR